MRQEEMSESQFMHTDIDIFNKLRPEHQKLRGRLFPDMMPTSLQNTT